MCALFLLLVCVTWWEGGQLVERILLLVLCGTVYCFVRGELVDDGWNYWCACGGMSHYGV